MSMRMIMPTSPPLAAARNRLIVALDTPTITDARKLVATLGQEVSFYKIGLELLFGGGIELAQELKQNGKSIFLDMKFLDIGNTVEKAVAQVARLDLDLLTIHGTDTKTMAAAVRGRADADLKLLAVTVMTNLDHADLHQQGIYGKTPAALVLHRAALAKAAGMDGVISSGHEAAAVRAQIGKNFLIVTPGIRLAADTDTDTITKPGADSGAAPTNAVSTDAASSAGNDQARVMTPALAIAGGASHLVVGRPITKAADPKAAATQFIAQIASAGAR